MDPNNSMPTQSDPLVFLDDGGDWRSQLAPESRARIVNKIKDTLMRHLPFSGQDGLRELEQIATRFEGKIYNVASSQSDYLRKISLKMLTMEHAPSNFLGLYRNPQYPEADEITVDGPGQEEEEDEDEDEVRSNRMNVVGA